MLLASRFSLLGLKVFNKNESGASSSVFALCRGSLFTLFAALILNGPFDKALEMRIAHGKKGSDWLKVARCT